MKEPLPKSPEELYALVKERMVGNQPYQIRGEAFSDAAASVFSRIQREWDEQYTQLRGYPKDVTLENGIQFTLKGPDEKFVRCSDQDSLGSFKDTYRGLLGLPYNNQVSVYGNVQNGRMGFERMVVDEGMSGAVASYMFTPMLVFCILSN